MIRLVLPECPFLIWMMRNRPTRGTRSRCSFRNPMHFAVSCASSLDRGPIRVGNSTASIPGPHKHMSSSRDDSLAFSSLQVRFANTECHLQPSRRDVCLWFSLSGEALLVGKMLIGGQEFILHGSIDDPPQTIELCLRGFSFTSLR
jgi:hypothetical protein